MMAKHQFKIGMYLPELGLPFDEVLGDGQTDWGGGRLVQHAWRGRPARCASWMTRRSIAWPRRSAGHGLEIFLINVGSPFKQIHLTDLELGQDGG